MSRSKTSSSSSKSKTSDSKSNSSHVDAKKRDDTKSKKITVNKSKKHKTVSDDKSKKIIVNKSKTSEDSTDYDTNKYTNSDDSTDDDDKTMVCIEKMLNVKLKVYYFDKYCPSSHDGFDEFHDPWISVKINYNGVGFNCKIKGACYGNLETWKSFRQGLFTGNYWRSIECDGNDYFKHWKFSVSKNKLNICCYPTDSDFCELEIKLPADVALPMIDEIITICEYAAADEQYPSSKII